MDSQSSGDAFVNDPSEFLKLKPKKSILKPSMDENKRHMEDGRAHFDEMNILATHHPADKDYGHMKIDEPKTPYHTYSDSEDDSDGKSSRPRRVSLLGAVDPIKLAEGLEASTSQPPVYADDNYSDDEELTPEQIAHKREFERKRKLHYNEGAALLRGKQLLKNEEDGSFSESME
ncbi:unnamed protein product [Dracunculus medinensis]|uniref:Protein phosphatase inhibitor 2 n=1 Tax=Dracunculus medinensis TaxID=318479 RepID=A0A0N4U4Z9_DRAME|nr:unnamed protein product [Dracunculus medinensis]